MNNLMKYYFTCALMFAVFFANGQDNKLPEDLYEMSLSDLMNLEITSVSKKAERLQDVSSSIYVLNKEDIANSGATNMIELLRTVPGFWATQSEYNTGSATIRNSPVVNGTFGTVLYLLDGTPIQDQMSSTFSFRNFDIPLDEIESIEIIRGSGGTVYGANSATGVVNIFTKDPSKYDGIHTKVEGGSHGYFAGNIRAGGKVSDNIGLSGYIKYRKFDGYGSLAGKDEFENPTGVTTRFTEDYEKSGMVSMGVKTKYDLSEKSKLSLNLHYNSLSKIDYTNTYGSFFAIDGQDELISEDVSADRLVGNLRFDHKFSDMHSIFARLSTNQEKDYIKLGGGIGVKNSMYDFEVQDNISIGKNNDFIIGVNYRSINFSGFDINSPNGIAYIDPDNTESLKGAFIQDKFKFLDDKLLFTVGAKAENYSLINDRYYLSPMFKFSFIPVQNITLWGGYTQSYTTPGYNNTNIDLYIFQTPTDAELTSIGMTRADLPIDAQLNAGVKNGSNTEPTKFKTIEIGFRTNFDNRLTFETNIYQTKITDGIIASTAWGPKIEESPTRPGVTNAYYYYGNYVAGTFIGSESMLKVIAAEGMMIEISHSWMESDWNLQSNDDFDINDIPSYNRSASRDVPATPEHIFRMKGYFDLPNDTKLSIGLIYATKYNSSSQYSYQLERYDNPATEPDRSTFETVAEDGERTLVNLKIEKKFLNKKLNVYVFSNDIFNQGRIETTDRIFNVTLSQTKRMFGMGLGYKF